MSMVEVTSKAAAWLDSVLRRLPATIRAVYVEFSDGVKGDDDVACFNAFGFKSLGGGRFDPANRNHTGELGDFTWEPSDQCDFLMAEHPGTDWLAVLQEAAGAPEVVAAITPGVQLIVGQHDGEVFVIK